MNKELILKNAREKMKLCKACKKCNGVACRNLSPGPGGKGDGLTFVENVTALESIKLTMDTIHDDYAIDTEIALFNRKLSSPIMAAPIAAAAMHFGADIDEYTYNEAIALGMSKANTLALLGDGVKAENFDAPLKMLEKYPDNVILTIKPWDNGLDIAKIKRALVYKPIAIAMDIDASGLVHLKNTSTPVSFKNVNDLQKIKEELNCPFIIKGIMSVEGARKALEAKADAIVVSNHGGRVLNDCQSSLSVLNEIASFVDGKLKIIFDGGIRSGNDVFKALALGADAVLVGRPLAIGAIGCGSEGVSYLVNEMRNELMDTMRMTNCKNIQEITYSKVKNFHK